MITEVHGLSRKVIEKGALLIAQVQDDGRGLTTFPRGSLNLDFHAEHRNSNSKSRSR